MAFTYTLEIPEVELQEKVSALMPFEHKKFFITLTVQEAEVSLLKDTDEVGLFAKIETKVPGGLKGAGSAKVRGDLSYDAEKGAFYLRQPRIEHLHVKLVPQKLMDQVKTVAQVAFEKVLENYPIYRFNDENKKHQLAKTVLKDVKVDGKILYLTLSPF